MPQLFLTISTIFAVLLALVGISLVEPRTLGTHGWQYAAPWDEQLYEALYSRADAPALEEDVVGAIVPHHLLAGHMIAELTEALREQDPSLIVLIGPNHFSRGRGDMITTRQDWQTIYGEYATDLELVDSLIAAGLLTAEEDVIKEEHAIYGLVPFFQRSLPDTTILPIALAHNIRPERRDELVSTLVEALPEDAVVIASIDFSHYQTDPVADFHDAYSMSVIRSFDVNRFARLEFDSIPSMDVLARYLEQVGAQRVIHESHTNAAKLAGNPQAENITSYYAPMFGEGPAADERVVSILHGGDVMLGRDVAFQVAKHGEDYLFGELAGEEDRFLYGFDAFSVNLEGPFVHTRGTSTKPAHYTFGFTPAHTSILQDANISIVSQANNHSYDYARRGQAESREILDAVGIAWYGSQYDVVSTSLIYQDYGSARVAYVGVNDTNGRLDVTSTLALIAEAEEAADHTIVNIHWGVEYELESHPRQRYLAHTFADAGADLIIGHHPHVVQEIEVYGDVPIFYSLGNLIFDQYWSAETQRGLLVGTVITPESIRAYLFPVQSDRAAVSLMKPAPARDFVRGILERSRMGDVEVGDLRFEVNY